jgi:preprotein translocase subunit YajC
MAILPLLLLPVLMYFLLIRPQQKKAAEQKALLSAVGPGDEIMTTSGIFGFVTAMEDDVVWLEVAEGLEICIVKGAIARRVTPAAGEDEPAATPGEADTSQGDDA